MPEIPTTAISNTRLVAPSGGNAYLIQAGNVDQKKEQPMSDPTGLLVGLIAGLILGLIALAVLGLVLQWLWNTTLPEVIGVKEVTLFQAIKILLIASILFGGHRVVAVQHSVEKPAQTEQSAATSSNAHMRRSELSSKSQADRLAIIAF